MRQTLGEIFGHKKIRVRNTIITHRKRIMVNVLCIMGGPRKKGNTLQVVEKLIEYTKNGIDISCEYLFLKDKNINQCSGCYSCNLSGIHTCPVKKDDIEIIFSKMQKADAIILAAPTFTENVPALTKSLFDRLNYLYHRPAFFGKPAVVVSTVGFYGVKGALKQLSSIRDWGFNVVDELGIVPVQFGLKYKTKIENKIDKRIKKSAEKFLLALNKPKEYKFNFITYAKFQAIQTSSEVTKYYTVADHEYYKDKEYYVDVKIPFYAKLIGYITHKILPGMIRNRFEEMKT